MPASVLVAGARGRFGRATAAAFAAAGWEVHALARGPARLPDLPNEVILHDGDASDPATLTRLAHGRALLVHATNPPYADWARSVPALGRAMLTAAEATGATVLIPGNVYVYGAAMPEMLRVDTPHRPTTRKGRIRAVMEGEFRAASARGVRSIVLRAGDFLEPAATGNWFDAVLAKNLEAGRVTWPGRTDVAHAFAWLPDMAAAAVRLAERRCDLAAFAEVPFPGIAPSGAEMRDGLAAAMGRELDLRRFPWLALRLGAPFRRDWRELIEMRYLWDVPHRLDPAPLKALLPGFRPTPAAEIYARLAEAQGSTRSTQTSR